MTDALVQGFRVVLRAGALGPWLVLTAVVCAGVVLLDLLSTFYASAVFVLLGPLLPLAGLALSYSPSLNADYELVVASPYPTMRLLLRRAAVFLALAAPVLVWCGHRLAGVQFGERVLVHAATVDAVGLALSTLIHPTLSAAGLSLAWSSLIQVFIVAGKVADITSTRAVALAVCTAAIALFVLVLKRRALSTDWRHS